MHHSFIDQYSHLKSLIHQLDPRVKVVSFFLFVLFVVLTPAQAYYAFLLYFVLIFAIMLLSSLPLSFVFKRSLVIIPFAFLIGLFNLFFKPFLVFFNILVKSWLSILSMIVLSATTSFPNLLKALESLKVPRIIIMTLSFMYRYVFTLMDQAMRLERARVSRSYGRKGLPQMKAVGSMLGSLFVRTYERGERIYQAMVARGFDGTARVLTPFALTPADLLFFVYLTASLVIVRAWVAQW